MRIKRLGKAMAEDAVQYVTGAPTNTLREIVSLVAPDWTNPRYFLDWQLTSWPQIYHREVSAERCLKVWHHGTSRFLPQVVLLDNTSGNMGPRDVSLVPAGATFSLTAELQAATEQILRLQRRSIKLRRRTLWNETLLRLADVCRAGNQVKLFVQGVTYEDNLRTNLSMDAPPRHHSPTLRQRYHAGGELEALKDSHFANPFGINFLLFSSDGQLLIQERSRKVVVRPGEFAPSSSGDFTLTDVPSTEPISFAEVPKLRETFEELGLRIEDVEDINFLGITRELQRGGKPEMFCSASTTLSEGQLRQRWSQAKDKFETRRLHFYDFGPLARQQLDSEEIRHSFLSKVDILMDRYPAEKAITLWTNLAFWSKYRLGPPFRAAGQETSGGNSERGINER